VAAAIEDLLGMGRTRRLPQQPIATRGKHVWITDADMRRSLPRRVDWQGLTPAERRRYFAGLNNPPPLYRARQNL
jgi:hypothetical protein